MAVADDSSSPKVSSRLLIFALVSSVVGALIGCLIYFSINGNIDIHRGQSPPPFSTTSRILIPKVCNATRFPELCEASLNKSGVVPPVTTPLQVVQSALSLTSHNLGSAQEMLQAILKNSTGNQNRTIAGKICLEVLGHSMHRLNSTADALPNGRMKDARAWTSAALSYQYDCWSGLKKVNDTQMVVDTMSFLNNTVITSTSISLSMMMSYEQFGNETGSWSPPKTERDGFWEKTAGGSNSGREIGVPTDLKEDVTVCNGGNGSACTHKMVQEAVDAAPENLSGDKRFVIRIKEGIYNETVRVPFEKKNLVFVGDGPGKTVITGSYHVGQPGMTTYESATVGVLGDGFMARDLTIENTAGPTANQAVALRSDSDLSVLENCELIGNQDTLYAHSLRQFYKSCTIHGNVDFIFGNSASFFHNCTILIVPRSLNPEMGENNAVSAHGRTDPAQTTGLFFQDCLVNGTDEYMKVYRAKPSVHKNYLGRPWKEFSRTVFVKCKLEELISPAGWMIWEGDFALNTLYYGEFGNTGLGSNLTAREKWSSQIPEDHVDAYSVQNFIQDDEWK